MIVNEFFENNAKKCDVREKKKEKIVLLLGDSTVTL